MRVTHVVAYQRGIEVHVGTWLRPGRRWDPVGHPRGWRQQEPRIGVRLPTAPGWGTGAARTATSPAAARDRAGTVTETNATGRRAPPSSWAGHPFPEGDALEVVVAWDHQGVPSRRCCSTSQPCGRRPRTRRSSDPPPAMVEGDSFGWFAYAPMSGSATPSRDLSFDRPVASATPKVADPPSGEVRGGELGLPALDRVEDAARDVVGVEPARQAGAVPASGRPARPVSVCGGRTSTTSTPDRRSSRASAGRPR